VLANLGQSFAIAGRYDAALNYMGQAVLRKRDTLEHQKTSTSLAYCLSSRGLVHADIGNFHQADRDYSDAAEAMQGDNDPIFASIIAQRCFALICQGRYREAETAAENACERSERAQAVYLFNAALLLGNYAKWCRTSDTVAFELFYETVLSLHASGQFQRISFKYGWLAEAWAQKGEVELVRKFATLAFRRALKGDRLGEASAARALATVQANRGQRGADHYLHLADRAAQKRTSRREVALNNLCKAQIALSTDKRDAALSAALAAKSEFTSLNMHAHVSQANRFLTANFSVAEDTISSR
jgi:tetratricopeptide (TPR) repeat protein